MEPRTRDFNKTAAAVLSNARIQGNLQGLYSGFYQAGKLAAEETPGWEDLRERARSIKRHTTENLDYYLDLAATNVTKTGGKVFFAKDAATASRYVLDLVRRKQVKTVIKGKSMVSEEMGLNHQLTDEGIATVETDLGEYIIQLAGQEPFHLVVPAFHMSKEEISTLLQERLGVPRYQEIEDMAGAARRQLRKEFIRADMGITGANFVVAESGTLVLVTNEGNGRMCTSMPRIHVAVTGMEKVIPSLEDLGVFLRLLTRSATGQRITSYVTTIDGPRHSEDEDGPEELHLVILDNGRSKLLADPVLREALYCLRCGACLNACPVYRKVGGHAYGWVYPGPIGAVVSPVLTSIPNAKDLPYASSLCGACREVCPVKIDIPRMLLHLRNELAEGKRDPANKNVSRIEAVMIKGWRLAVANSFMMSLANRLGRLAQWPLVRNHRIRWLPPPLSGWTRYRTFPRLASAPFHRRWQKRLRL